MGPRPTWVRAALQLIFAAAIPAALLASKQWPEITPWMLWLAPFTLLLLYWVTAKWGILVLPLLFNDKPWIKGTYKVKIASTWKGQSPHENLREIEAFAAIRQNSWGESVSVFTEPTTSRAFAVSLVPSGNDYELLYTYRTQPPQTQVSENPPQLGTASLDVIGRRPRLMTGRYFTDRPTQGDLVFERLGRKIKTDFQSAREYAKKRGHSR